MADAVEKPFLDMAERIQRNPGDFGGAFVIVPPGDLTPIVHMIVGPDADEALFLSNAMSKIQLVVEELKRKENRNGFGR